MEDGQKTLSELFASNTFTVPSTSAPTPGRGGDARIFFAIWQSIRKVI